jgi:hypothetical protein
LVEPGASARLAQALPWAGSAVWDARALLPEGVHAAVAQPEVRGAEEERRQGARAGAVRPREGPDAEVPRQEEEPDAEAPQREARAAAVRLRAAPGAQAARPSAALPSVLPWAFRRDQPPPWPVPSPAVRLGRAMERSQIASP